MTVAAGLEEFFADGGDEVFEVERLEVCRVTEVPGLEFPQCRNPHGLRSRALLPEPAAGAAE